MAMKNLGRKVVTGIIAATAATGIGAMVASPAMAAVTYRYTYAGTDYAYARICTTYPTYGRAIAHHGTRTAGWTPWVTSGCASALADDGWSSDSWAAVQWTG